MSNIDLDKYGILSKESVNSDDVQNLQAFKQKSGGTAEIITKDRRFIERLFDNSEYVANK